MRAKEIKIENSFISIFWQWLGSASLRKNKINSKQTREWAAKPNWTEANPNETFFSCLCDQFLSFTWSLVLFVCVCVVLGLRPTSVKWPQNVPSACWLGLNLLQFPSIAAFYAPFLFFLSLSSLLVVSAFVALKINEARMCWIVLIGALPQSGHKLRHCNANSIIKATWAARDNAALRSAHMRININYALSD